MTSVAVELTWVGARKLTDRDENSDLVLADESTADPFVVGGTLRLPAASVAPAARAISKIKYDNSIAPLAKIHCKELFHGSTRLRSPFKAFDVKACHELLASCVDVVNALGAQWYGTYCDASAYPTELRLIDGKTFRISKKHVAALTVNSAMMLAEGSQSSNYQFAFDPDSSLIDWGLAARTQATHFSRTHPAAIELKLPERSLLDLADIAAYALAQSCLVKRSPERTKWWQEAFPPLIERMRMQTANFFYDPKPGSPSPLQTQPMG